MKKLRKKMRKARKKRVFNFKGYLFGAARKIDRWNPERRLTLKLAEVSGIANVYVCAKCDRICPRKGVQVDHIAPVIDPKTGFTTWDEYYRRLDVSHKKRQVLCKDCHQQKTQDENQLRRS